MLLLGVVLRGQAARRRIEMGGQVRCPNRLGRGHQMMLVTVATAQHHARFCLNLMFCFYEFHVHGLNAKQLHLNKHVMRFLLLNSSDLFMSRLDLTSERGSVRPGSSEANNIWQVIWAVWDVSIRRFPARGTRVRKEHTESHGIVLCQYICTVF